MMIKMIYEWIGKGNDNDACDESDDAGMNATEKREKKILDQRKGREEVRTKAGGEGGSACDAPQKRTSA